jgi:hypothetical protein
LGDAVPLGGGEFACERLESAPQLIRRLDVRADAAETTAASIVSLAEVSVIARRA